MEKNPELFLASHTVKAPVHTQILINKKNDLRGKKKYFVRLQK